MVILWLYNQSKRILIYYTSFGIILCNKFRQASRQRHDSGRNDTRTPRSVRDVILNDITSITGRLARNRRDARRASHGVHLRLGNCTGNETVRRSTRQGRTIKITVRTNSTGVFIFPFRNSTLIFAIKKKQRTFVSENRM